MTQEAKLSFDALLRDAARLGPDSADDARLPALGDLVQDKYRIEERLGSGGMGVVYRATNLSNGKTVALKWLRSPSPRADARFLREAYAAAKIDHPNVVNVFDVGMHRGARYLVMELLRGESLGQLLRREQRLTPARLCAVLLPALRGLAAVHAAGLVHRDLKPDNIFLCSAGEGEACVPKLLDFGISKQVSPPRSGVPLTGEGCGLGTPGYMSPEQVAGLAQVDARTDIYALGVLMYEALTGCLPGFSADARGPRLHVLAPELPPALERVVLQAMASDPADRFPSADALSRALRDSLLSARESAPAQPARASAPDAPARRRWAFGALGIAAALAVLVALGSAARPAGVSSARVPAAGALTAPALGQPADTARSPAPNEPVIAPSLPAPAPVAPTVAPLAAPVRGRSTVPTRVAHPRAKPPTEPVWAPAGPLDVKHL